MATALLLLTLLPGCGRQFNGTTTEESQPEQKPTLIAEEDREHDFGTVIGKPGQKMGHRYHLTNTTRQDVKIVNVINRKTCCGVVKVGPLMIRPGESTDVDLTLVVGDKFGAVVHETEVLTDLPSEPSIILRTTATAHTAFRIEEISRSDEPILAGAREPRRAEYRVFAAGTTADPAIDLGRLELRSTIKVDWVAPKEESPSDDGLTVESRRFTASLDPDGPPGERKAEALLQDGKNVVCRHDVNWEVVSPITASPKVIVMKAGKLDYRVLIQSSDKTPFRITRVECSAPGVQGRSAKTVAGIAQIVEVDGVPRPKDGRGVVTVFTDHPAQAKLDVSFILLD